MLRVRGTVLLLRRSPVRGFGTSQRPRKKRVNAGGDSEGDATPFSNVLLEPIAVDVVSTPANVGVLASGLRPVLSRPGVHLVSPVSGPGGRRNLLSPDFLHVDQPGRLTVARCRPL